MSTPRSELATGWDLGGAHLKVAQSDAAGGLQLALQIPCTLWRGLDHLTRAIGEAQGQLRAEHLKTHLETTAVLGPEQVDRYVKARGY